MTELSLLSLVEALGGWEIVVRAGAVVGLTMLMQAAIQTAGKTPNAFIKRATGFIAAAVIALLWGGPGETFGRELVTNWFTGTVLWAVALKPMLGKLTESWRPSGGQ